MKRRLLLLIVLVALGGLAWWLSQRNGPTTLDRPLTDFAVKDTSSVDRIFIAEKNGRNVDLRRTPQGWTVNGLYLAKQQAVSVLLKTFLRVEVRSPVQKRRSHRHLARDRQSGQESENLKAATNPRKYLELVGHATKDHFGTYMVSRSPMVEISSAPFVMAMGGFTGVLNTRFHADLDEWRNPAVFSSTGTSSRRWK